MNSIIRRERLEDIDAVYQVNEQAFGGKVEPELVNNLRKAGAVVLSLVAEQDGRIVGHVLFSPMKIELEDSSFEVLTLSPLAVLPEYQRKGIGIRLVKTGLEECLKIGHEIVTVLGHAEYYPRFGFVPAGTKGISCEFEAPEEAWMILELKQGALAGRTGTAKFHPVFRDAVEESARGSAS